MLIYIGLDDTDILDADRGTGRLARDFAADLPAGCELRGVVRQQLPRLPGIPYTANNSSACVLVAVADPSAASRLTEAAAAHLATHFIDGSDPGLCVALEDTAAAPALVAFARVCCHRRVTQQDARAAAAAAHLSGHGGTCDGIIGAAAAVGLTLDGWSGRYIEWGDLRAHADTLTVGELEAAGIQVVAVDRDAVRPWVEDAVDTAGWLRPRLWAGGPVLAVRQAGEGRWRVAGGGKEGAGHRSDADGGRPDSAG